MVIAVILEKAKINAEFCAFWVFGAALAEFVLTAFLLCASWELMLGSERCGHCRIVA